MKGGTITSDEVFPQTTHTRNIRRAYYYCEVQQEDPKYNSLDEVKQMMHSSLITCREINCLTTSLCNYQDPVSHDVKMNETITFNNWAYNEYIRDAYNSNPLIHYELLLKQQGFTIGAPIGSPQKFDSKTNTAMSALVKEKGADEFAK